MSLAWWTFAVLFLLLLALLVRERMAGRSIAQYLGPSFRLDLFYSFLILGGIYGLLHHPLITYVDSVLREHAPFLYLKLLQTMPEAIQLLVFLLAVDFCRYWKHRLMHSNSVLRAFHTIHHGAEQLNPLTAYRIHLVEYLLDGLATLLPVVLLGAPPEMWLPVFLGLILFGGLHHSGLNISFGWFDRILVSPRFHETHHSTDSKDFNSNFGALFSIWDFIFGTANLALSRPHAYGLGGLQVPRSFVAQTFFPVRILLRGRMRHTR